MSEHVDYTPTRRLIRDLYERRGCFRWNKPRFLRLCAKLNETEAELGERIGLLPSTVHRRYSDGFTRTEGILLTFIEDAVDALKTQPASASRP